MFRPLFVICAIALAGCDSAPGDQPAPGATTPAPVAASPSPPKRPVAPAAVATARFSVEALTCEGCAWQIRDSLQAAVGVVAVRTDVPTKRVTVEYDSTQTSATAIAADLRKIGYDGIAEPSHATPQGGHVQ